MAKIMWTAFDADDRELTPDARNFLATIRAHGWICNHGDAGDYTAGLYLAMKVPEIIVTGLDAATARVVLRDAWRLLSSGRRFETGKPYDDFFHDCAVVFQPVTRRHYETHLGWSVWFYGGETFDCWQMVLPDDAGRFPWQAGFDGDDQPDLSEANWNDLRAG